MKQQFKITVDITPAKVRTQKDKLASKLCARKRYQNDPIRMQLINKVSYYKKCLRLAQLELKEHDNENA